ncbi:MAG: ornithine carbamoyltransferase [Phycisphaerales bacterium JB050]
MTTLTAPQTDPSLSSNGLVRAGGDFLTITNLSQEGLFEIIELSAQVKSEPQRFADSLKGTSVALLFEKPSLRTRAAFEVGINKLGGHAVYFDHNAGRLGERESVSDYAKNLERWFGLIVARTYSHESITELAEASEVPVINALSDLSHPCQALADVLTLSEHMGSLGSLKGEKIVFVGEGNNVCCSLIRALALCGSEVVVISPEGYEPREQVIDEVTRSAEKHAGSFTATSDLSLVAGARAVYTDVWTSMGSEDSATTRIAAFTPYQVNADLMALADPKSLFLHCLPAKRGQEVTDAVIDGPGSVVFDQAENRMHTQNAVLLRLLGQA